MGRGLGQLQKNIIDYLNTKAENSENDYGLTVQSYANLIEITTALNESSDAICQALSALIRRGWVRIYPNDRKRDRYYGIARLPAISSSEIKSAASALLANA